MFSYSGDDLAVFALCVSLGVPFGWEAIKERGWRRPVAAVLCALLLLFGILWWWIKANLPSVGAAVVAVATNLETWAVLAVLLFALFLSTLSRRRLDSRLTELSQQVSALAQRVSTLSHRIEAMQRRPRANINWAIWKQRNSYTLREFAAVLADADPGGNTVFTAEMQGFLKLIQEDVMSKLLPCVRDRTAEPHQQPDLWPDSFSVKKPEAIKWANARGFDVSNIS